MNPRVCKILSNLCKQNLDLLRLPSHGLRIETKGKPFETILELDHIPGTNGFLRALSSYLCLEKVILPASFQIGEHNRDLPSVCP